MRIAHVREHHAPAGAPWRLAVALAGPAETEPVPVRWLDLEVARRRIVQAQPDRAHNDALFRTPLTTLDDHLTAGRRIADLRSIVDDVAAIVAQPEEDGAVLAASDLQFGPPILQPPSLRDFYVFEAHVATMWRRRGSEVPEAWYRMPIFYFGNVSEVRGPGAPVWAPRGSNELDFELEVCAVVDVAARDLDTASAEAAIGGYCILDDWSARDLQRDETTVRLGPAKGKDFATSIGPWITTPDELASARQVGAAGPHLAMTATVHTADGREVVCSDGRWSDARFSFGAMLERASADVRLRPGDLIGSGTVGSGSLLESREGTLGRYLEPGDVVTLAVERLGSLRTPIVARGDVVR